MPSTTAPSSRPCRRRESERPSSLRVPWYFTFGSVAACVPYGVVIQSDGHVVIGGAGSTDFGLARHDVVWLPSPPRTPRYRGNCGATNSNSKVRTQHFADRTNGGYWSSGAAHVACCQADQWARPRGYPGPSPNQGWNTRVPILQSERDALHAAVAKHFTSILAMTTADDRGKLPLQRQVRRQAVRRGLLDLGLLTFVRRTTSLPVKLHKPAKIS